MEGPRIVRRAVVLVLLSLALLALLAATPGLGAETTTAIAGLGVKVGAADCGSGWTGGPAGRTDLALWNDGPSATEVYLQDVGSGRILLDVESLGSQATRAATVTLPAGSYRFVCATTEAGSVGGAAAAVTGDLPADEVATPGVLPVTSADLVAPLGRYQHWVAHRLHRLQRRVRALHRALVGGDRAAAMTDWKQARLLYDRIGAAYDAFGSFDSAIDGRPTSGIPPPGDRLHGLPLIEELLWHGRPPRSILPAVDHLATAVRELGEHFGTDLALAPIDIGLRTHEILEDADRQLADHSLDTPSRTGLATLSADLVGTRAALRPLLPLLRDRDPRLGDLQRALTCFAGVLRSLGRTHGQDVLLHRLPRADRERLEAALDGALELLSDVAVITDPVQPMPDLDASGGAP